MNRVMLGVCALVLSAGTALAGPNGDNGGGAPGGHGLDGRDFGAAVSGLAQDGGVADHVSSGGDNAGGMPAAHGTDGKGFGEAVSGAAQGGGIGGHASGRD